MAQFEFTEVRFFARAQIRKTSKEVTRLGFFKGTSTSWPSVITYELVATQSGSTNRERVLATGQTEFVHHMYRDNYNNRIRYITAGDLTSGRVGRHDYYPLDLTYAQQHMMEHVNTLGGEGWELVSAPASLGAQTVTLDIYVSPPGQPSWEFQEGEMQFYIGANKQNPLGIAYSFKRVQRDRSSEGEGVRAASGVKYCVSCGNQIPALAKFCADCGQPAAVA